VSFAGVYMDSEHYMYTYVYVRVRVSLYKGGIRRSSLFLRASAHLIAGK